MTNYKKMLKKDLIELVTEQANDLIDKQHKIATQSRRIMTLEHQLSNARDAAVLLAERYNVKPQEMAQLGLGHLVKGKDGKPVFMLATIGDLVSDIKMSEKSQATVAKFRQLKKTFLRHQEGVTILLDRLSTLGKKNYITKEDLREFQEIRNSVSKILGRSI